VSREAPAPFWERLEVKSLWPTHHGSHYVRDGPSPKMPRASARTPTSVARLRSFAYNLLRTREHANVKNAGWRAALDINYILEIPLLS